MTIRKASANSHDSSFRKVARLNRELMHLISGGLCPDEALFGKAAYRTLTVSVQDGVSALIAKVGKNTGLGRSFLVNAVMKEWLREYLHEKDTAECFLDPPARAFCIKALAASDSRFICRKRLSFMASEETAHRFDEIARAYKMDPQLLLRKVVVAFTSSMHEAKKPVRVI